MRSEQPAAKWSPVTLRLVTPSEDGRSETSVQRDDRHLAELLTELRIALPGAQVLFGFLLTVPFTQRFLALTPFQKRVYFVTLLTTALTTALFVAPSANHRLLFQKRDKAYIVRVSNRLAIAGIALMALSMCGALLLVSDIVFDASTAFVTTCIGGLVFAWFWFIVPLIRRVRLDDEPAAGTPSA